MNKKLFTSLFLLFAFVACKHKENEFVAVQNPFEVLPTNYTQNILLENFTSELCTSCIENKIVIDNLKTRFPNLFVASIHSNDYLEIPYANYIGTKLGGLIQLPIGTFNRNLGLNTQSNLEDGHQLLTPMNWENAIAQQNLTKTSSITISIETLEDNNDVGTIKLHIAHKQALSGDYRLMLYFTEDQIEPFQVQNPPLNFKHNNVLKDLLPSTDGESIDFSNEVDGGEIITKIFNGIDMKRFNTENLNIIAFVYKNDLNQKQAHIVNVQQVHFGAAKLWD